jgi:molybdopterin-guanine dinucleotide biosynthesis protein A
VEGTQLYLEGNGNLSGVGMAGETPATPISAVILAGGRSTRLGQDKAFLKVNGQILVERLIDRLAQLSEETIIVTNDVDKYEHLEATVIADLVPGKAALGGLYSGLRTASNAHSLVVACDMPFLNLSLLRYMQGFAGSYDVVIPRVGEFAEALHAIYAKRCLPYIEHQLQSRDLQISHFFPAVRVRYVEQEEIEIFDPDHLSFFNINSQEDLDKAREIWSKEESGSSVLAARTAAA